MWELPDLEVSMYYQLKNTKEEFKDKAAQLFAEFLDYDKVEQNLVEASKQIVEIKNKFREFAKLHPELSEDNFKVLTKDGESFKR